MSCERLKVKFEKMEIDYAARMSIQEKSEKVRLWKQ